MCIVFSRLFSTDCFAKKCLYKRKVETLETKEMQSWKIIAETGFPWSCRLNLKGKEEIQRASSKARGRWKMKKIALLRSYK